MQYTPGRVYRHKTREAQRYRARAQRLEVLFAGLSLLISISFLVMFVKWWLI